VSMRLIEEKELRLKSDIEENIEMLIDWIKKIDERLKRLESKMIKEVK
jgi:hypothetical protein